MAYSAIELINNAYYTSGMVGRGFKIPSASQTKDGLRLLNQLLTDKAIQSKIIPYFSHLTISCVVGQEIYFVPNLIFLEELTFELSTVRYALMSVSRSDYFGLPRADGIITLPNTYFFERQKGGANIYLYPLPNLNFPLNITGKFALSTVTLTTDLQTLLDDFYISYLEYDLANRICSSNNITLPAQAATTLAEYKNQLVDISPLDLTIDKFSTLSKERPINYGDVNFGRGWTT